MKNILAIDIGTTNIKATLVQQDGLVLRSEFCKTPLSLDEYGSCYYPNEVFNKVEILMYEIGHNQSISAIILTGMAEAGIMLNRKTGLPISNIIPWFDTRTTDYSDMVSQEQDIIQFSVTGLRNSYKYGIYKFIWALHRYQASIDTTSWLSMVDYVAYRCTGVFATDPTFAARTYLYNIQTGCWDTKRLRQYGLTELNLPTIYKNSAIIGYYKNDSLQSKRIPVSIAGHDHICCTFGSLFGREPAVCNSIGTAEAFTALKQGTSFCYDAGLIYAPLQNDSYVSMGNITSSSAMVEHFRNTLQYGNISYKKIDSMLAEELYQPSGIMVYPFLHGMGTPDFSSSMKSTYIGIDTSTTSSKVTKAVIEGINYQGRLVVEHIEQDVNMELKNIYVYGGATKSHPWMQIKADILGKSVVIDNQEEGTSIGAIAWYLYNCYGIDEALNFLKPFRNEAQIFSPDKKRYNQYSRLYEDRYKRYLKILKEVYHEK